MKMNSNFRVICLQVNKYRLILCGACYISIQEWMSRSKVSIYARGSSSAKWHDSTNPKSKSEFTDSGVRSRDPRSKKSIGLSWRRMAHRSKKLVPAIIVDVDRSSLNLDCSLIFYLSLFYLLFSLYYIHSRSWCIQHMRLFLSLSLSISSFFLLFLSLSLLFYLLFFFSIILSPDFVHCILYI